MEECSKRDLSAGFFRRIFIVLCEWGGGGCQICFIVLCEWEGGVMKEIFQQVLSKMLFLIDSS